MIKKCFCLILIGFGFIVMGNVLAANLPAPKHTPVVVLNRTVAVVNDDVITQNELNAQIKIVRQQLAQSNTPTPDAKVLQKQVLNDMINAGLQMQVAKQAGITVSDAEVSQAVTNIAKRNHMSLAQLKESIEVHGMKYKDFRKNIRKEMIISRARGQAVGEKVNVSKKEIAQFMKNYAHQPKSGQEYHVGDILIATPDAAAPTQIAAVKAKAEKIMQQLRTGANFKKIAVANSSSASALKGGDLGWRKLGELPSLFADKIKTMKTGAITGPLQAANGFHIIKLLGIRGGSAQKITKEQAEQMLYQRKFMEAVQPWIDNLRSRAYVKIML